MGAVLQIAFGLLGLSLLVFLHELGHFAVARLSGVRVKTFSVGFGPKVLKVSRGGTEYCVSAIPFGGYVAMAGEHQEDRDPEPGDFTAAPLRKQAAIVFAGPFVNIVLAFALLWTVYVAGVSERESSRLAVGFVEEGGPGALAGILTGDTIVRIDGRAPRGWDAFHEEAGIGIGRPMELGIRRDGKDTAIRVVPKEFRDFGVGYVGLLPLRNVVVQEDPAPGTPAAAAGFLAGDTVVSVAGVRVASASGVIELVEKSAGEELEFVVRRGGSLDTLAVSARRNEEQNRWLIGVLLLTVDPNPPQIVKRRPAEALAKALEKGISYAVAPIRYLSRMARGEVKVRAMSGPVGIVQVIGRTWQEDFAAAAMLLALISMNLGVMNLLPLAITDGGVLCFLLLQGIRGKPLSRKVQERIQTGAMYFFLAFFLYVTFQDILRFKLFLD